jgi:hypothetical protein
MKSAPKRNMTLTDILMPPVLNGFHIALMPVQFREANAIISFPGTPGEL